MPVVAVVYRILRLNVVLVKGYKTHSSDLCRMLEDGIRGVVTSDSKVGGILKRMVKVFHFSRGEDISVI